MSANHPPTVSPAKSRGEHWIPPILVCLLPLFPPEARGEALAGCAALVLLLTGLCWRRLDSGPRLVLGVAGVGLLPLIWVALAPGAVIRPWAIFVLAAAAGLCTATLQRADEEQRVWPWCLALVGGIVALHGIYQATVGLDSLAEHIAADPRLADRSAMLARAQAGRAFGGFPTPAALGGFMIVVLPTTVAAALGRTGRSRWALLALALLQAVGLLATASATATGALLVAVALFALTRRGSRRLALGAALAAGILVAGVVGLRGEQVTDASGANSPWRLRAANFRIAAAMAAAHPWIGVGPGGYGERYPAYRRAGDNESQHAHNLPLELVAEWGLPLGALLAIGFYVVFLGPLFSARRGDSTWRVGAALGLAALALQNLLDFTALLPSLLWLATTLRGAWEPVPRVRKRGTAAPALALVGVAAVGVATLAAAGSGLAWEQRLVARHAAAAGEHDLALARAERATRLAPWNPDGWLYVARAELAARARGAGELSDERLDEVIERAVAWSPVRPSARLLRAERRLARGDLPGAYADAAEAARLYPLHGGYAETRDELADRFVPPSADGDGR